MYRVLSNSYRVYTVFSCIVKFRLLFVYNILECKSANFVKIEIGVIFNYGVAQFSGTFVRLVRNFLKRIKICCAIGLNLNW